MFRKMYAPVLFSPLSPSFSARKFKTGRIECFKLSLLYICVWVKSSRVETVCKHIMAGKKPTQDENNNACSVCCWL